MVARDFARSRVIALTLLLAFAVGSISWVHADTSLPFSPPFRSTMKVLILMVCAAFALLILTAPKEEVRPVQAGAILSAEDFMQMHTQIREMQKLVSQTPLIEVENQLLLMHLDKARAEVEKKLGDTELYYEKD